MGRKPTDNQAHFDNIPIEDLEKDELVAIIYWQIRQRVRR